MAAIGAERELLIMSTSPKEPLSPQNAPVRGTELWTAEDGIDLVSACNVMAEAISLLSSNGLVPLPLGDSLTQITH